MKKRLLAYAAPALLSALLLNLAIHAQAGARAIAQEPPETLGAAVDRIIRPLMDEHAIPGMAIGITVGGERYCYYYGLASLQSGRKVDGDTIFEIGSVSKTFTVALASWANERGSLSFEDKAVSFMPELAGSGFDAVRLLDLATYTAGGLPLQLPDAVRDMPEAVAWLRQWKPAWPPGAQRQYSNPSIGLLGHITALSMHEPFERLMEGMLLPSLGLANTFLMVPQERMHDYAYGYAKGNRPVRVTPGVFDAEAYGIKTTAPDMVRYIEVNMGGIAMDAVLLRALARLRTGYFSVGRMSQGLGWELYPWPSTLEDLLAGNSTRVILNANAVDRRNPVSSPDRSVLANKTGSTNGFGAYVAFIPDTKMGVVLLANRNYPIPARIRAAFQILEALERFPWADCGASARNGAAQLPGAKGVRTTLRPPKIGRRLPRIRRRRTETRFFAPPGVGRGRQKTGCTGAAVRCRPGPRERVSRADQGTSGRRRPEFQ